MSTEREPPVPDNMRHEHEQQDQAPREVACPARGDLGGRIHFDGASRCARVKLVSYDADVVQIDDPDYSLEECPATLDHYGKMFEEGDGSGSVIGRPGAASVKVVLQTRTPTSRGSTRAIRRSCTAR